MVPLATVGGGKIKKGDIMTDWNFGLIFRANAKKAPNRPAQIHSGVTQTWGTLHQRANALATDLLESGLGHQSKVSCYLYNSPEYLETMFATFLAGCAPINTNYRYGAEEIVYLFDNADAEAVVFHGVFAELIDGIRARLPKVKRWYMVSDSVTTVPAWAIKYEDVASRVVPDLEPEVPLSGDDLLLLYTGGTTGMPKGVMWRQNDLYNVLGSGGNAPAGIAPVDNIEELLERLDPQIAGLRTLVACPLMHGTGQFMALNTLAGGGCLVTLSNRSFDVPALWQTVQDSAANIVVIVGQAFAGPMLEELDAHPEKYDLSSVVMIASSGVMWQHENKQGLLVHMPTTILFDSLGSSEAVGLGGSMSVKGAAQKTAQFVLGPNCAVFTEDGDRVQPGSGKSGVVAVGGAIPLGYYKDEVKTTQTFRIFEGRRWSVPGDWAEVNADGSVHLLGRGSVCINTGGEKVFPEEVEEAMKTHPAVRDAVAVGLADKRFGETICGVVEFETQQSVSFDELNAHVKKSLAAYKAPRNMVVVSTIGRAANGKVDYKRLRELAESSIGAP